MDQCHPLSVVPPSSTSRAPIGQACRSSWPVAIHYPSARHRRTEMLVVVFLATRDTPRPPRSTMVIPFSSLRSIMLPASSLAFSSPPAPPYHCLFPLHLSPLYHNQPPITLLFCSFRCCLLCSPPPIITPCYPPPLLAT